MKRSLFLLLAGILFQSYMQAQDTIVVKTLNFDDITKRTGTYLFPPPQAYEKVLMDYTLKCDERTTQDKYPCGEWDYLTYTTITDSTGQYDSTKKVMLNYMVRGGTPPVYRYRNVTTPDSVRRKEYRVKGTSPQNWFKIDDPMDAGFVTITSNSPRRNSFVIKKSDLVAAGMTAGYVTGMRMDIRAGGSAKRLTISLQEGSFSEVPDRFSDAVRVFDRSIDVASPGAVDLLFHRPFNWSGNSDIVVTVTADGGALVADASRTLQDVDTKVSIAGDRAYHFIQGDRIALPKAIFPKITDEVSVAFWALGDLNKLPKDNSVFEAFNDQGQRVLNAHLPWSNSRMYWDAGADRIEKDMPASAIGGQWNHWVFTKNCKSGMMRVYLNGKVFHQDSGHRASMSGIASFYMGWGNAGSYEGMLDNIQVFNKELDAETIAAWMSKGSVSSHPLYANMLCCYQAPTDEVGSVVIDSSKYVNNAMMFGRPERVAVSGTLLETVLSTSSLRPSLSLQMAKVFMPFDSIVVADALPDHMDDVVLFERPVQPRIYAGNAVDHPAVATDTIAVYEVNPYIYYYDASGKKVDSVRAPKATDSLIRKESIYFDPVVIWEIGRYITPYGIGLDLGPQGFRWTYDVTDYAPLLRNNVTISAGNQQELIDVTFRFVKGQPARTVKQIDQVIDLAGYGYAGVVAGTALPETTLKLSPDAVGAKLRTRTSGHGWDNSTNCAEFCNREHYLKVNGTRRFTWNVWKECASNPVYPQGGTWVIDRTGWCPGAPVDEFEHELTPYITPGSNLALDYDVQSDSTNGQFGEWVTSAQMIAYGKPNRSLDVAIDQILSPTTEPIHRRINPVCGQPIIVIQNLGSTKLTSATINYGIGDDKGTTYSWSGSLDFLARDTVFLPTPNFPLYGTAQTFTVSIAQPNGQTDEYMNNNTQSTSIELPPVFGKEFEVRLRTNSQAASQYEWILRKIDGAEIGSGRALEDNKLYTNKYTLEEGCYEYILTNSQGYGLDLWFVRNQLGSGSLGFYSGDKQIKQFNPDFGNVAWMQFRVGALPSLKVSEDTMRFVSPTETEVIKQLYVTNPGTAPVQVANITLSSVNKSFKFISIDKTFPYTLLPGDTITCSISFMRSSPGTSVGSVRVESNDAGSPFRIVRLEGSFGTDVEDMTYVSSMPEIQIIPNPSRNDATLKVVQHASGSVDVTRVVISDVLGNIVATLQATPSQQADGTFDLPALPSGAYSVSVYGSHGMNSIMWNIVR